METDVQCRTCRAIAARESDYTDLEAVPKISSKSSCGSPDRLLGATLYSAIVSMYYYFFFSSPVIFVAGLALLVPAVVASSRRRCLHAGRSTADRMVALEHQQLVCGPVYGGADFWLLRPPRWFKQRGADHAPPSWQFTIRDWLLATIIFGLCIAWLSAMVESGPPRL